MENATKLWAAAPVVAMSWLGLSCGNGTPGVGTDAWTDVSDVPLVACTEEGARQCSANVLVQCSGGFYYPVQDCTAFDLVCVDALGCVECVPGRGYCEGDVEMVCNDDGMSATEGDDCSDMAGHVCDPSTGTCASLCDMARAYRSNIGCEYWAVDLDNWYGTDALNPDASGEQFALVVTNPNDMNVTVTTHINNAAPGAAMDLSIVDERSVAPMELVQIDLPQREVDGSVLNQNDGTGTALTSRAFRVTSSAPIVAYQFNPVYQMHTNDASILLPTHALDDRYWVMGWPGIGYAAGAPLNPASTNYGFLTIVGTEDATEVQVTLSADISPGGPVTSWTPMGSTVVAYLNRFDVFNIEAHCSPSTGALDCMLNGNTDFTGSEVRSSAPVAVFAGVECANVGPTSCDDGCCCDHLEDQIVPASSLGERFVAPHSPYRGGAEVDFWRVLADRDGTVVTTSLPSPWSSFSLDAGDFMQIETASSFTIVSSDPVIVGQYLVSQGCTSAHTGDPSFTSFPPVEQYRQDYTFLVPATFDGDNVMIARSEGTSVRLDDLLVPAEFTGCEEHTAGLIDATSWSVIHCPVTDGPHHVTADAPVGIGVYGYGPAGSYAYPGGTNLERINVPL